MEPVTTLVPSTADGAELEVVSVGSGPGVVLSCGGAIDFGVYRRLAERLAPTIPVHVLHRRGRRGSAPRPADYGLATETADLASVLDHTGSTRLIGHSVGGFFALAAARDLPQVTHAALYDPTISVDGGFPSGYMPEFARLIAAGQTFDAMVLMGRELNMPETRMPMWAQRAAVRAVLLTPPGRTMGELLPTVPEEAEMAVAADGPASAWAGVAARTRFSIGERSAPYYLPMAEKLVAVMPHAELDVLPKLGHDGLARAGAELVASLGSFLTD